MWNWLKRYMAGQDAVPAQERTPVPALTDERLLELEREVQSLRLELEEKDRLAVSLKKEMERRSSGEGALIAEAAETRKRKLLADMAAPVAQLMTQAHLIETDGKQVQARDVLAVARRMVRVLEDEGLTLEGRVGETAHFDPDRHEPLGGDSPLAPDQRVVVRFVGIAYQGKILRKAGVERVGV